MKDAFTLPLRICPKKIMKILGCITVLLILLSLTGQIVKYQTGHNYMFGFIPKFHLDEESNIPTCFSSLLLLISGVLLFFIASLKRQSKDGHAAQWMVLSVIFFYLSVDESASIHELFILPLRETLGTSGIFYFAWIIPAGVIVVILALFYLKFLFRLPRMIRYLFLTAGVLYVGGALFGEAVGGYYTDSYGQENIIYAMITTIEESMEMVGLLVFLYALLSYVESTLASIDTCDASSRLGRDAQDMPSEDQRVQAGATRRKSEGTR